MAVKLFGLMIFLISYLFDVSSTSKNSCDVCIEVLKRFKDIVLKGKITDPEEIEEKFMEFCETSQDQERRFCYYLGGLAESATRTLSDMSKPMSWGLPVEKICIKLGEKDEQLCHLKYKDYKRKTRREILMDFPLSELKRLLKDLKLTCDLCFEKEEFVEKILSKDKKKSFYEEL
ncbi:Mesencephalic astrocyte-derived neurotrophic factor [Araneus ventricosus]|uniref:Mesencephalic astrocyte-derived neurotrophic factor n=1 Tax=Araneus ventricosus TaxID=182803 RepID=A0A4Y2QV32_ARAVE|nr:Mesencephalic astrocyte-derived neurotrophic factor [Araneus ventricosus]GBN67033.1 Mesencephalic astrocyte-derived neurotrophic factor [Araneus ventricosus]